jgi:putative transposase
LDTVEGMSDAGHVTRAMVFTLDVTPGQERMLQSYCGAARRAHNWVLAQVKGNLDTRTVEREDGGSSEDLTPALSWSMYTWQTRWNAAKGEVAPWWRDVSMHAFRTGIHSAAEGLKNFSDSKAGKRAGPRVGFPRFKSKNRAKLSVSFTELNHQLSWLHEGRHGIRLMLPKSPGDPEVKRRRRELEWMHTVQSTRKLYKLVDSGQATIQKVTVSKTGGRWQASFLVRCATTQKVKPVAYHGGVIGVDLG